MDKPIVAVVWPGVPVPAKLALVVDRFLEWHDDPAIMAQRMADVMAEMDPQ